MKRLATLIVLAVLAAGTAHAAAPATGIHWGEARPLGTGTARAYVAVDVDGSVSSFGVSIDEAALQVKGTAAPEALLPLPADLSLSAFASSKAAWAQPAFRVRYDRAARTYLVMLDGLAPATGRDAAQGAAAMAR
jgi:hypothetical protein